MINKFKFIIPILVAAFLLPLSSCDNFDDLNVDPNEPVAVPAENLVTQSEFALNNLLWGRAYNAEWGMLMVQHWSQNEYTEEGRFDVDGNNFDNQWITIYAGVIKELDSAKNIIEADENVPADIKANQLSIIEILTVHAYQNLTDAYGDIVYTQALNSIDFPLPAYDSQKVIYTDLVARLRTAIGNIDTGAGSFASGEAIYGGNMTQWKKLGNSLLMRIAMRMSNVDEGAATSAISGITPADLITTNADNAMFPFDANAVTANPLYVDATLNTRDDFSMSSTLVELLEATGDPRISAFAATNPSGEYVGIASALSDASAIALKANSSRPADAVRSSTAPAIIMDAAEVHFMLAEAYQRGMLTGDAAAMYDGGVTASMNYWGFTDATAISDYLAANPYDAANWDVSIGTQKWLAFYMNGPQAWAEWRRLGQPVLTFTAEAEPLLNDIPVRLPYPISEQTLNSASLEAVDGGNANDLSTRLWWDVD